MELGVILIKLYPNSTHIYQPNDVCLFRGLKESWNALLEGLGFSFEFVKQKSNFPILVQLVTQNQFTPEKIKNAFKSCGLCPWNADEVDYSKCLAISTALESIEECDDDRYCDDSNSKGASSHDYEETRNQIVLSQHSQVAASPDNGESSNDFLSNSWNTMAQLTSPSSHTPPIKCQSNLSAKTISRGNSDELSLASSPIEDTLMRSTVENNFEDDVGEVGKVASIVEGQAIEAKNEFNATCQETSYTNNTLNG